MARSEAVGEVVGYGYGVLIGAEDSSGGAVEVYDDCAYAGCLR